MRGAEQAALGDLLASPPSVVEEASMHGDTCEDGTTLAFPTTASGEITAERPFGSTASLKFGSTPSMNPLEVSLSLHRNDRSQDFQDGRQATSPSRVNQVERRPEARRSTRSTGTNGSDSSSNGIHARMYKSDYDYEELQSLSSSSRTSSPRRRGKAGSVFDEANIKTIVEAGLKRERKTRCAKRLKHFSKVSRVIVDNKYVVFVSVVLTFFALAGDDVRLLGFEKSADFVFDCITILCISFFAMEVVLSCIGKSDYFWGFFFWLDTIATVTLAMDLTWVNEYLFGGSDDMELGDHARSGRTARVGASIGRMVRVLRLIRIFKLYKAYYANKQRRKREEARRKHQAAILGGHDRSVDTLDGFQALHSKHKAGRAAFVYDGNNADHQKTDRLGANGLPRQHSPFDNVYSEEQWLEDEEERALNAEQTDRESLVGKKLSELTTRRVIILVLTMLLVLPTLRVLDPTTPEAPSYAADMVFEAFQEYLKGASPRDAYERAMLKAIYYHNWFTGQDKCENRGCPSDYFAHLFWVGGAGVESAYVRSQVTQAHLSEASVTSWDDAAAQQDDLYNFGKMPAEVLPLLHQDWNVKCTVLGVEHYGISLTQVKVADKLEIPFKCPTELRKSEWTRFAPRMLTQEEYKAFHFAFYFDLRQYTKLDALFSLSVTVFICLVLCLSSVYFSNDANRLVLQPLEQMIIKIEAIRDNPLIAMKMADQEFKDEEVQKIKKLRASSRWFGRYRTAFVDKLPLASLSAKKAEANEMYETVILEKTLVKLGWLLSLVFGEAGANIVSQNMSGNATAGVNAMVPGTRVECIIGHARIRHFSTATEVLQGKVMAFVNQVAEIVHGIVDQYHGSANQNNGSTFLLIWRMRGLDDAKVAKLGDMSVVAFAKILAAVHRSPVLAAYRAHPGLQQRFFHKVNVNVGLHAGWAIEGAVGSEFKIDASYLSPNVTIASRLEGATSEYGVSFLASQAVTRLCRKSMVKKCRLIDKVTLSGFTQPLELYTLDLDFNSIEVDDDSRRGIVWNIRQRFRARQILENEKSRVWTEETALEEAFDNGGLSEMRQKYTFEFFCLFSRGYQNYSQGEWQMAKKVLSRTKSMLGVTDGPSDALLRYMEARSLPKFSAPDGWKGVRALVADHHVDH